MSALAHLVAAYSARPARAAARAGEAVYYLGLDVPVELIRAAGFTPILLAVGASADARAAEPFAEGCGHPYLRAITAALLDQSWGNVRRLVISTTPSFYFGLFSLIREAQRAGLAFAGMQAHLFDFSRAPTVSAGALRERAMAALRARLEAWGAPAITPEALRSAIVAQNKTRALQSKVQALRASRSFIGGAEALAVFGAESALGHAEYDQLLTAMISENAATAPRAGKRVIYSGTPTHTDALYRQIEVRGRIIIADDQDAGSRAIGPLVDEAAPPLQALAARYFSRAPAAARWDASARTDYLLTLAQEARAESVLFHFAPWDHPPAWDYPAQRRALESAGIASELWESEHV